MSTHKADVGTSPPDPAWSRPRTLAVLSGAGLVVLLLAAGLVLAAASLLRPPDRAPATATVPSLMDGSTQPSAFRQAPDPAPTAEPGGAGSADELAAAPMPTVPQQAARPAPMSTAVPPPALMLPASTGIGPAGVATGFLRTEQGAVAQLAEIDRTLLSAASLPAARELIGAWAVPGGPTAESWSGVRAVAALLESSGTSGGATGQLTVLATPLMGLVKGSLPDPTAGAGTAQALDGPGLVVACVNLEVDVTVTSTARAAVADCQRMVWDGRRWRIGPGPEPAAAPSVWPGTDLAYTVGWRDLRPTPGQDTPNSSESTENTAGNSLTGAGGSSG